MTDGEVQPAGRERPPSVRIYSAGVPSPPFKAEPEAPYVDYAAELRAALAVAVEWLDSADKAPRSILLFGHPGNGRAAFARRLASVTWTKVALDVAWVSFTAFGASQGETLESAQRVTALSTERPLLLVLEDLDLVGVLGGSQELTVQVRDVLEKARELLKAAARPRRPLMVVATSRDPEKAVGELTPLRESGAPATRLIYFNWPDENRVLQFYRALSVEQCERVAGQIFKVADEDGVRYTAQSLITGAIRGAARIDRDTDGAKLADLVDEIRSKCCPVSIEVVNAYESATSYYIELANITVKELGKFPEPEAALQKVPSARAAL